MARRIFLAMMVVMVAGAFFTSDLSAAQQWFTCRVDMAGPGWGGVFIKLSDSSAAFTKQWFYVPPDSAKEMLATALTAMNSGMNVVICTDLSLGSYPPLYTFYLTQ